MSSRGAQTALSKVGEVPPEQFDPQVRLWASKVREASYDMEDILDTCLIEVADPAEKKDGLLKNITDLLKKGHQEFNKSKARHTIAGAIEDMKKRLHEVSDRRDRFFVPLALPAPATKAGSSPCGHAQRSGAAHRHQQSEGGAHSHASADVSRQWRF
ncbi:uncharacterized protein [Miscanthus floridulus]|uniref:uncharacterized protein n=1 Tax=Miscanthus floridulus TaxID=154761 RepID=UPI003458D45A